MRIVTLLTDFGTTDYYVAAVKGVLLGAAPDTTVVDITHDVLPQRIETATFLLAAAVPAFPTGTIHLAVVDPGVGTSRRVIAAATAEATFVAPDNGLLEPFLDHATVVAVDRPDLWRRAPGGTTPSHTFHGRDRFAPVTGALAAGEPVTALGPVIDDPVRAARPAPSRRGDVIEGRVVHIDRFGNAVTDVPGAWLPAGAVRLEVGGTRVVKRADNFDQLGDEPGMLVGSLNTVELSLKGESFARHHQIDLGMRVRILCRLPSPPRG